MCDIPHTPWLTLALVLASLALFALCFESARRLLGITAVWGLAAIALPLGWFAEQMGSSHGWFFGHYCYTSVLGPRLGDVPLVIPLMWFALVWIGLLMANLMLWREPWPVQMSWGRRQLSAWLAAMIITAFDLGADPYFVFQAKAWIMDKKDGGWFGETLQGFVGWMVVSFVITNLALWRVRASSGATAPAHKSAVLWPLLAYSAGMVFQMVVADPVEIRAIAFFAMGIPLVVAFATYWDWKSQMEQNASAPQRVWPLQTSTDQADPLADDTASRIVGPWVADGQAMGVGLARLMQANQSAARWGDNAELARMVQTQPQADADEALQSYLRQGQQLPAWVDAAKVQRAEELFMAHGPLSCTLLFCASLPECYVAPHLAKTLHISGQLEAHTEYRIRQTAAMIFPVMMRGGMLQAQGHGVSQILKVRLVHATIRHLILHGNPKEFAQSVAPGHAVQGLGPMQAALLAQGWRRADGGLPCSQFELAYTLLTFGYVFLRGLRTMGLPWPKEDEEAYLHLWNVVGHVLGVREDLMAHSMPEAQALFAQMQAFARTQLAEPDARPALGQALVQAMANAIRVPLLRALPVPMVRWLLGRQSATDIGLSQHARLPVWLLFATGRAVTSAIDGALRLFAPQFSLARMLTRVLGYHFVSQFLLDQSRPIKLPQALLSPMSELLQTWSYDPHSPAWVNRLEDRLTVAGHWGHGLAQTKAHAT
jgi:uncharacterized membrane protein